MNTIYITGDAYTDEASFLDDAARALNILASDPEVGHVVRRMQTRTIFTPSNTDVVPNGSSGDTAFGAYIHPNNNLRLNLGRTIAWHTANAVGYYDAVMVLINTSHFGGGRNTMVNVAYAAARNVHFAELLKHEFLGHAIGGLGDEYSGSGAYTGGNPPSPNLDIESDPATVKWSHLIGQPDGMGGVVGVFEGGAERRTGIYRPTLTSKMRQLGRPWGPVNAEAIIVAAGRFIPPLKGDLNGDGRVDFHDLNLALAGEFDQVNNVLSNFGRSE
jgi:hypothetical protein